uniref:Uncharacterized protein n=1 Tax=Parascaris univalens TaxID=6257 RepID=A0A915AMZ7_PARUN
MVSIVKSGMALSWSLTLLSAVMLFVVLSVTKAFSMIIIYVKFLLTHRIDETFIYSVIMIRYAYYSITHQKRDAPTKKGSRLSCYFLQLCAIPCESQDVEWCKSVVDGRLDA